MTRTEFIQKIESTDDDLKGFLESMSEQEWKDPDLCIVDYSPSGTIDYWWPNILDADGHPKGFTLG